jgi:hypothetical protein
MFAFRGELCAGHRPDPVHCLVETKAYTNPHQRHARRSAEIDYHLSQELLKFLFVNHDVLPQRHRNATVDNWSRHSCRLGLEIERGCQRQRCAAE